VQHLLKLARALLGLDESDNYADKPCQVEQPLLLQGMREIQDKEREDRQVGAKALEERLELRNDEDQQNGSHNESNHNDCRWIEQCLLDLLLQRFGFFFISGDLVEQRVQNPGLLAGLHQVAVERVEVQRMLGQCFRERGAAF